jgi:hypothetical protein
MLAGQSGSTSLLPWLSNIPSCVITSISICPAVLDLLMLCIANGHTVLLVTELRPKEKSSILHKPLSVSLIIAAKYW